MGQRIDENYFIKNNDPINKNKIEDVLDVGEKILLRLKPHKKTFILESIFSGSIIALIWGGIDAAIITIIAKTGAFKEPAVIGFMCVFFAFHLLPVWLFVANVVRKIAGFKNIDYVLTNKRIICRSGLVGIDLKSIFYSDVIGVNVKVGIFDRIFKVGDIYISAKNQSTAILDVKDPYFLMSRIQKISHDIKADIEFPNDYRPKENHGYNTDYIDKNN